VDSWKKLPNDRRDLMIAKLKRFDNKTKYYKHDLYLNGNKETIFFDID